MTERLRSLVSTAYGVVAGIGKAGLVSLSLAGTALAEEVTVVALGDSLTQGYGLVEEQGFVPQLQTWLRARGHEVVVENHGVSGDTTAGGLARIGWALGPEADALIVALGGNDLLRGLPPEASRANLDGILAEAAARGLPVLLIGLSAPGNYGPDYKAAFDAIYPDLAEQYGALHVESFLAPLSQAAEADPAAALVRYMQPDGIHPNAEGVALIVEALGPEVEALLGRISPRS
ncbi:arylesterase [Roseibacterium sp. SDUM158016]|uniref:arylesterase n=1 Tax=Roseicyclus sediminis TaxID=2980997 RepID=UPI0021D0B7E0|nr:arylesterase [Roseibacterium sp. SDUM158016]MCU4653027.1 arylesterase [Roseibacterium sp. SDUM158016]